LHNVRGEPVVSVMAAGWFCEKSGWIGKVADVKPVLLKTKRISTGNHFKEEDFYSGGALYIMFENHVRSWPLLKTP
jgi:hypothetical protein